jgi:Uma2 family endonuclease
MAHKVIDRPPVGERRRMSYEAWRTWDEDEGKSEWVDGEVIVFMPATPRHGDLWGFFYILLSIFVKSRSLGRVFAETLEMHLSERGRVPDVLFIRNKNLYRLTDGRLDGPADLVIEVVSDDSVERDHTEKKAEYAAAGVEEYWVLESREGKRGADFYHLVGGVYQPIPVDADGRLWSTVVEGFWLKPEWLWHESLPDPVDCLHEIAPESLRRKRRRTQGNQKGAEA